jgi:hypothetical protein
MATADDVRCFLSIGFLKITHPRRLSFYLHVEIVRGFTAPGEQFKAKGNAALHVVFFYYASLDVRIKIWVLTRVWFRRKTSLKRLPCIQKGLHSSHQITSSSQIGATFSS